MKSFQKTFNWGVQWSEIIPKKLQLGSSVKWNHSKKKSTGEFSEVKYFQNNFNWGVQWSEVLPSEILNWGVQWSEVRPKKKTSTGGFSEVKWGPFKKNWGVEWNFGPSNKEIWTGEFSEGRPLQTKTSTVVFKVFLLKYSFFLTNIFIYMYVYFKGILIPEP